MREFKRWNVETCEREHPWIDRIFWAFLILVIGIGLGYAWAYVIFH